MLRHIVMLMSMAAVTIPSALAGITVSPAALYLDKDAGSGRVRVMNTDNIPRVVGATMQFGYPASDARGNVSLRFFKGETDAQSATQWITAYPEQVVLQPGEVQVFVFSAQPPAMLAEGEYWARPIIHSVPVHSATVSDTAKGFGIALSINYRHGRVETGVNVNNVSARAQGNDLAMTIDLTRRGNAAYLGNMVTRIRNRSGRCLFEKRRDIAVYRSLAPCAEFEIASLQRGAYTAEVEFNTQRTGNAPGDIILAPPVTITLDFTMPDRTFQESVITTGGSPLSDARTPVKVQARASEEDERIKSLEKALEDLQKRQAELVVTLGSLKSR